jgi:predicted DNA binding CopG/RHH family protein
MIKNKIIPNFKSEDEERDFWAINSALDYYDENKVKEASFPNLKPTSKSISIRLPENMLNELKILANKQDVPYQSLVKIYLNREIQKERKKKAA